MKKFNLLIVFLVLSLNSYSMHIMEGYLPIKWAISWGLICIPFWIIGIRKIQAITKENSDKKILLALAGAFIFVLSALKIPSVTGSSSHPTGVGLAAILFGPSVTAILGTITLIFQAGLLAHGGFTTLGANSFSMAIGGPILSYIIYKAFYKKNRGLAIFLAAALGDLFTYCITSFQLALAHGNGNFLGSLVTFMGVFALTQIPLAIIEGLLTKMIIENIEKYGIGKEVVKNENN